MIPTQNTNKTTQVGASARAAFQISSTNGAMIMKILRSSLYTDKPLAVLREYSANAWDAHRSVGKGDVPIEVTLPSYDDLTLKIRDRGPGLSHEQMFELYTQYGDSTKREGNDQVGMLGIGSKSAFCYTTSFTIVSRHGGMRRVYVADLGEDNIGGISLVHESPCPEDDTGLEIQVAVRPGDKYEFEQTARKLFRHFEPRPTITQNGTPFYLPPPPDERTVLQNGVIYPETGEWIAIVGCVPYRVNLDKLDASQVNPALRHMSGRLQFDIGTVQFSASREELEYLTETKQAIVDKANALVDEFVLHALKDLESGAVTGWQARLQVRVLEQLELPLPDEWKELADAFAKITYDPTVLTVVSNRAGCTRILVGEGTTLYLDDTGNDLAGYNLAHDDYIVKSARGGTLDELRAALDAVLATSGLTGVKVELLSSKYWSAPKPVTPKRTKNAKHRARMFKLAEGFKLPKRKSPKSDNWEGITRVPTADDVFVVIEAFYPMTSDGKDDDDFWGDVNSDRDLCEALGITFPTIYGYKSTEKVPVKAEDLTGVTYRAWRDAFFKAQMTDERKQTIELIWQSDSGVREPDTSAFAWLIEQLGTDHPIVKFFADVRAADKLLDDADVKRSELLNLADRCGMKKPEDKKADAVFAPYKLLRRRVCTLWERSYWERDEAEQQRLEWAEYVKMVDERNAPAPANVVALRSVP